MASSTTTPNFNWMSPGGSGSGVGSNQWLSGWPMPGGGGSGSPVFGFGTGPSGYPSPGASTSSSNPWASLFGSNAWNPLPAGTIGAASSYYNKGSGVATEPPQYQTLAADWSNFLQSQVGQGTGANPLLQQALQFYSGGTSNPSMPGAATLQTIANQGISALPEWQAMVQAQQQNIQQNQAQLREQFASMGDLAGSPFGTAMSNYMSQTAANQNALLGNLQQTNILQGQIPAAQGLMSGANQMAQFGQSLLPAYNPLNQYMQGLSQTYAPMFNTKTGGGVLGGLLGSSGALGGVFGDIAQGLSGGGGMSDVISSLAGGGAASGVLSGILSGIMALCHVAASFYGWDSFKTKTIQFWMLTQADPDVAMFYMLNGERIATTPHRFKFKPLFDSILMEGAYAS